MIDQEKRTKKYVKGLLKEYSGKFDIYNDFAASIRRLMLLFLKSSNIDFQSVTSRPKDVYNLKQKIKRKTALGRVYNSLDEITDLAGVRVILYFKDDIQKVLSILKKEFIVHKDYSVDKHNSAETGGYTSIHRIISLKKMRGKLREYSHFSGLKCELQIRTVLQHAWAEIEHGIGYKPIFYGKSAVGDKIKSLFKSTAEILELADSNFVVIKNDHNALLDNYKKRIGAKRLNIPINTDSLASYLSQKTGFQEMEESKKNLIITQFLEIAKEHKMKTIKELDNELFQMSEGVID